MAYRLVVDQGTGATQCKLMDELGQVVAQASAAVAERSPHPSWVEHDARAIWRSLGQAVRHCLALAPPVRVSAVDLSPQSDTALVWRRKDAAPVTPVLVANDQRTQGMCNALTGQNSDAMFVERTGTPLNPLSSALKIRWLLDDVDPQRRACRDGALVAGTVDAWLLAKLGAEPVMDVAQASQTQLLHVREGRWDAELLAFFHIPEQVLPRVAPTAGRWGDAGAIHPALAGVPVGVAMASAPASSIPLTLSPRA